MFIKRACSLITVLTIVLPVITAQAADVTINVSGKIIASPCEVDGVSTLNVDLGQDLQAAQLSTAGSYSNWVPFVLSLKNCPSSTNTINATFSGTGDSADINRLYVNTGVATNIAVELQSDDSASLPLGNSKVMSVSRSATNMATFPLKSRVWSKGNATTGTIASVVSVTFSYQ